MSTLIWVQHAGSKDTWGAILRSYAVTLYENSDDNDINKIITNNYFLTITILDISQCDMIFVIKRSESQVFKAKRNTALVRQEGN